MNGIMNLGGIARFAGVTPSTASHHLSNMIRAERVKRIGRGKYVLTQEAKEERKSSPSLFDEYRTFFENFSNFEKTFPGVGRCALKLNDHEKSILLEILSKENRYTPFTATELGERCRLSVKYIIEYARNLVRKGLIEMKKDGRRWVFVPKEAAIKGLIEFFQSSKKQENVDKTYSKKEKVVTKEKDTNNSKPVFETFEEALQWQIHNAHRMILQFRILRCDHEILRQTAWIFEKKAIQRHLPEAYVYKAKDVHSEILNVCPKKPFIFNTQFEFQAQLSNFINDLRKRLKDYEVILDLSKPVKVCLEHRAIENDEFARQSVRKGLLYLKVKTVVTDEKGEPLEIVTVIDKSRAIHLEWQGSQNVDHYATNYSDFVEDVATGRIDKDALRELPEQNKRISENISEFTSATGAFTETADRYTTQIEAHIGSIQSLKESTDQNKESADKMASVTEKASEEMTNAARSLTEAVQLLTSTITQSKDTEDTDIESAISSVYSRNRAKIPAKIYRKSKFYSESNTKSIPFIFKTKTGHVQLIPAKGSRWKVYPNRELLLPKWLVNRRVKKGLLLRWWLQGKVICLAPFVSKEGVKK